jgi:hypothetical protein
MSRVPSPRFVRFALSGLLVLSGCSRSGAGTERSLQDPASTAATESSPSTNVPQAARSVEAPSAAVASTMAPAATTTALRATTPAPHAGHGHAAAPTAPTSPASAPTPAATTAAKATYSCPMHPEVQKDSPGSCPKCGMNLVKK